MNKKIEELDWKLHCALHDIQAYRGALGYPVPGDHSGRLMDGTTPQCGMCNSEYRKNLEAKCAEMRDYIESYAPTSSVKAMRALSSDCGKGFIPAKELEPILGHLKYLSQFDDNHGITKALRDELARLESLVKETK